MVIPESEEVRREHWRRGDFRHCLPSLAWLNASVDRFSKWCWDHYALLLVVLFVVGPALTWTWTQLQSKEQS